MSRIIYKVLLALCIYNKIALQLYYIVVPCGSDNLDGALEEFEKLVHEHKFTPFKAELTQKFISLEDGPR